MTTIHIAVDMQADLNAAGLLTDLYEARDSAETSTDEDDVQSRIDAAVAVCYKAWAETAEQVGRDEYGLDVITGEYQPGRFEGDPAFDELGEPNVVQAIWQTAHDRIDAEAIIDIVTHGTFA